MIYEVTLGQRHGRVQVERHPEGGWWIRLDDGERMHVTGSRLGNAEWSLVQDGALRTVAVAVQGERLSAQLNGRGLTGEVVDPRDRALQELSGSGQGDVATPMPGAVVRVQVEQGDVVRKGQVLVVVEAMKMENEFKAPSDGRVDKIHVKAGDSVDGGAVLITLTEPES